MKKILLNLQVVYEGEVESIQKLKNSIRKYEIENPNCKINFSEIKEK